MVWSFRTWQKSFSKWFGVSAHGESRFLKGLGISAHGESYFPNSLEFPHMSKVVSRMVWCFRAWRKLFPERFGVSAHGESHFQNVLMFPRLAKVVSRMVWCFRAWQKLYPECLMLSLYAEIFVRSWAVCCCLSLIPYNFSCLIMASVYLVEDFLWHG